MPGIARKILICAAIDGLIIQPLSSKGQRPFQPVAIKYGDASVSQASRDQVLDPPSDGSSFEAFGIIGEVLFLARLITVSRLSYLISITRRQQVAQICGSPIYVVTEVALTPCSSKAEAEESIRITNRHLDKFDSPNSMSEDGESSDDEVEPKMNITDEVEDAITEDGEATVASPRSSVAEDVFHRRGSYAQVFFGSSRSFYFSYDFDITRSLEKRAGLTNTEAPLYTQVDSIFFWNRSLLQPFLTAGQDSVALPVMQGFIGQRTFTVDSNPPQVDDSARESVELSTFSGAGSQATTPGIERARELLERRPSEKDYTVTLISRRSTKRAGLRYLRRGINQDGFVANMVETEQLLSPAEGDSSAPVHSFLQIRGSIPLFFTQTPYAFKPVPVLQYSEATNRQACQKHFERLTRNFGAVQIVSLVEKHGVESTIGTRYENTVDYLNRRANEEVDSTAKSVQDPREPLAFEWFDFHEACRGMKFENVSLLLSRLRDKLESFGSAKWVDGKLVAKQNGVVRTNCMDCLDRTNVCQSSFARHMLEAQLKDEGVDMSAQVDQETSWFNTLWADNGDAVSKQYASTAAMKGDYTRTKKRDYRGALNDLGLSLARFYSGMVNDYFSQTAIDFLLGNVNEKVFDEFEADMMTKDPAISITKMREQAIELCQKRVVADEREEFLGGWALLSPNVSDTIKALPMEEVVLLLTDAALYLCRFDWNMDKVSSFERVNLANVTGIKLGTYITSTISPSHADPSRNVGFVIQYQPGKNDVKRTNTRTFSSLGDFAPKKDAEDDKERRPLSFAGLFSPSSKSPLARKLAFKAPYINSSTAVSESPQQSEMQQVATICAEIERLVLETRLYKSGEEKKGIIERGDIISLEEAKKNTGLLEQLGHSIKKLVWA
ncbi:hypothetical protein ACO1O0_002222 [Amphichorda felina]